MLTQNLFKQLCFLSTNSRVLRRCYVTNLNVSSLRNRGLFSDIFPDKSSAEILDVLNSGQQTVYAGFDPTADSLHVGNLLILINLIHWQRAGHKVIALIGGATAQLGDPSGRSSERRELTKAELSFNAQEIERSIKRIFDNHVENFWNTNNQGHSLPLLKCVNNLEWYDEMKTLDFVGKIGRSFRIGTMMGKQSVRDRLSSSQGMSFTEFSYQILQAYDWMHLLIKHKCRFQVGGNDQMGNIVAGYDYIQKVLDRRVFGLTVPLVTTEEGNKFGKSAGNAVWLNESKTSAFNFYQFFVRTKDSEVEKLLKLFTFEPLGAIRELMSAHNRDPGKRLAQKVLADNVTKLVHGASGLQRALDATAAIYDNSIDSLAKIEARDFSNVFQGATTAEMLLKPGLTVLNAAMRAGCFKTEMDAIRIITAGGFYINNQKVVNGGEILSKSCHILPNNISLMRVGKKNYTIVKWS